MDNTRVDSWTDFIGQDRLKHRLRVHIDAAVAQGRPLEHILLATLPGFGKTALAAIIAKEMQAKFIALTLPVKESVIAAAIEEADENGQLCVLLLDEIHSASKKEQEFLLPLLEFGVIKDKRGRTYEVGDRLTIIGATTEPDKLIPPLYDRFTIRPAFDSYSVPEMARIILGMATKMNVEIAQNDAVRLAGATGGVPRNARSFVLAARDLVFQNDRVTVEQILSLCRTDETGLSVNHMSYLKALKQLGGMSGLKNIQALIRLPEQAIRDLEQLLLTQELVTFSPQGRELLVAGRRKLTEWLKLESEGQNTQEVINQTLDTCREMRIA